nr:peptidoglycan editing factor PgeF [Caldimonas sp.]
MTTRSGGVSRGRYEAMNVGVAVGDDADDVAANRRLLADATGASPVWLRQVHGTRVVRVAAADAAPDAPVHEGDGVVTTVPGVACVVQAADCLPVLLAAPGGRAVGAAHAGWRGLARGVVEAAVDAVAAAAGCAPVELAAWLGACIGPDAFEVGGDVLDAFAVARVDPTLATPRFRAKGGGKWLADLGGLARDRLVRAGVREVSGGEWCTASDAARFFSYRRDGVTGRMAAAIWIAGR